MWFGIPYTGYGYNVTIPAIPRIYIFSLISGLLYILLCLPQILRLVGNITGFDKFDDKKSNDIYYLNAIHGLVYSFLMFLLLKLYNPYFVQKKNIVV